MSGDSRLLVPQHEKFAQMVSAGKSQRDAYRLAGYASNTEGSWDAAASRLANSVKVRERIAFLVEQALIKYDVTADKIIEGFAATSFYDPGDYFGETGMMRPLHELSPMQRMALKEVETKTVRTERGVRALSTKIKWADRNAGLKALAQIKGLMTTEGPPPQSVVFIVERSGDKGRLIEHDE